MTVFLRGLARCFRTAEGREKMLAARWSANILLVLCVALLLDFCSCTKVRKETATELEDLFSEDFNNGFTKSAFVHNTEKLVEDDGDNDEDENNWAEEEEDEDEVENEGQEAIGDREDGEEESENGDEDGDEDDNDLYEEDKTGEYEDDINTEDQYRGDRKDGEEESENGDGHDDEDDNDLAEDENEIERNEIEGQDEDEDVDDTSDLTAMDDAYEAQVAVREKEGKVLRLKEKSING